jgi:saccharopine dehydrogenase-like NADP-dependent oxidoreductase
MNIVKRIDQYNNDYVYLCEPIKNNVMNEGNFIRILYSTSLFVMNGISLLVTLYDINIEKYYNKYKCTFNTIQHKELIDCLRNIEEGLLRKSNIKNKIPQYKINEQLKNGNIKLFLDNNDKLINGNFMLKISGIWETESYYGLTYKFLKANNP